MSGRIVARTLSAAALGALLLVAGTPAALAASQSPPGHSEDVIALPNGFQPEGIAIDHGGTGYTGSLVDGDVYVFDVRSGEEITTLEGPGTPSVGLKIDDQDRLFIAGGPTGKARVVDADTGDLLESYTLTTEPSFINDVVLTRDAAWFTDSQQAQLYKLPLERDGDLPESDEVEVAPAVGRLGAAGGLQRQRHREDP